MKHILQIIVFLLINQIGISQQTKNIDGELLIGGIIPKGYELSKVYGQGLSSEFRLSKSISDFLMIKPFFNYSFLANYPNDYQLENIHFLTLGLHTDIVIKIKPTVIFYFGPSICAIHYFDYLDWADKNILDYKSSNIVMSGNLISYDLRLGLNLKRFILELNYKPIKSEPKFRDAFNSLKKDRLYELYKVNYRPFDLSMFSINIGIKL